MLNGGREDADAGVSFGRTNVLGLSIWKIIIIAAVIVLLFGSGKISDLMGDVAKGIKSFKKGMAEDDEPKVINPKPAETATPQDKTNT